MGIKIKWLLVLWTFTLGIELQAQVTGVITDSKTGKPLADVEVFLNRTTIGSVSDELGKFQLESSPTGFVDVVLYKKGYALYRSSMKLQSGKAYDLKLALTKEKPKKAKPLTAQELTEVKNKLSGENRFSKYTLLNEAEITVSEQGGQRIFSMPAPISIQVESLGYGIKYFVNGLKLSDFAQAPVRYEYLQSPDVQTSIDWEKNRKTLFLGSERHWLMALVGHQLQAEGYSIKDENGNPVDEKSMVATSPLVGYSSISLTQPLVIQYAQGTVTKTSRVSASEPVTVNASGSMLNAKILVVTGDMASMGLVNQLPLDYEPIAGDVTEAFEETMLRFYEKTYVHTDKPYYYPGERIWFKAYMNYYYQPWRDSLSKTLYVELINPEKEIVLEKTLRIDSGRAHNDFIVPDTLKAGTYYLRAYTNLQRNFGDDKLFVKPIPILNLTDKVVYNNEQEEEKRSDQLTIKTDKPAYKTRDKIILTLQLKDKDSNPMAGNFSISITDAAQVMKVPEWGTIEDKLTIRKEEIHKITNLPYPLEYGVGFSGQFVNDTGKPEKTMLTFMQLNPRNVLMAETDAKGFFQQRGLNLYDTTTFYYKADKAKDLPYGNVKLLERDRPAMNFTQTDYKIDVIETGSVQRIFSEYEKPKDVTLLKEVEVKGRRIDPDVAKKTKSAYGASDVLLTDQDLGLEKKGYPNLLYYIVGKVPGLDVYPDVPAIAFTRAATQSITFQGGPLVTVNDVPMAGDAAQVLSMINPNNVESIGFTKRVNVLYGSQGAFGVISIFLKNGISEQTQTAPNYKTLTIFGYSKPSKWRAPDYDNPQVDHSIGDYRSTIYWNPEIAIDKNTGEKTFSFFAADLESTYRIEVQGVARDGSLIHFVYHVMVNSN
jgi:hypothetical protein